MKRIVFIYLCALLAFTSFYACRPSDANLQKEVNAVLMAYPGATASVHHGVVTLTGYVDSEEMKLDAERATQSVQHIKSVTNNIMVNAPAPVLALPTNPDHILIEETSSNLSNDGYNDVHVMVSDGEVTLTGKVKRTDLERVIQIANEAGSKRVINQLEIE
ncbi:MAG: BON domain-containing protein [Tannerellaceae bacterium]|nr:BON domain-containing protein [Tannerellaceae bacterium]